MQNRIFSIDSAKALKAQSFGWLNAIHYLAPYTLSGVNVCPKASAGCAAMCLGWFSGQAAMAKGLELNSVRKSRMDKTQRFFADRQAYLKDVVRSIELAQGQADRKGFKLCVRMNGSSDIAWEGIRYQGKTLFELFPGVVFVDYTKLPRRFNRPLPANYHLTFSLAEDNKAAALELLAKGHNVAVVFGYDRPETWEGFQVIDGDQHDLRHLDPKGVVVGLTPKGVKARRDSSGMVQRLAA